MNPTTITAYQYTKAKYHPARVVMIVVPPLVATSNTTFVEIKTSLSLRSSAMILYAFVYTYWSRSLQSNHYNTHLQLLVDLGSTGSFKVKSHIISESQYIV